MGLYEVQTDDIGLLAISLQVAAEDAGVEATPDLLRLQLAPRDLAGPLITVELTRNQYALLARFYMGPLMRTRFTEEGREACRRAKQKYLRTGQVD